MVEPENKRKSTPEAAYISTQPRFTDNSRSYNPSNVQDNDPYESNLDQMDDLHGAAAMALTALSSGVGTAPAAKSDMEFEVIESNDVGMDGGQENLSGKYPKSFSNTSITRENSTRQGECPISSNEEYRMQPNALGEMSVVKHERTEEFYVNSDVFAGSEVHQSRAHSNQKLSSITATTPLPNKNIPISPPFNNPIGLPLDSPTELPKRFASQVPGERMHTLSHLLEDQLSLASMTSDSRIYDEGKTNRHGDDGEFPDCQSRVKPAQIYTDYHPYRQSRSSPNLRTLADETKEGIPAGTRPFSASPPLDHAMNKPKRRYTKKSPTSLSAVESQIQTASLNAQESELLQSDRGLILKTQIPKKGRPISKHSSSQSTPTLSSLGVLPASHPYFSSKSGVSSSSTFTSSPPIRPLGTNRNPNNMDYFSLASEIQIQNPVRRRPGRPPLAITVARLAQSQSHASLLAASISRPSHDYDSDPQYIQPRDSRVHNRPRPPPSKVSPSPTTAQFSAQHHSHVHSGSHGHDTLDYEQPRESQSFEKNYRSQTPPTPGLGPINEGIPAQLVNRKRDSYGAEKRQSTEDIHRYEDERRSISSILDTDEGQDDHYQDQFEHTKGGRSRKRLSRTEMDAPTIETNARDKSEIVQKWLGYGSDQPRPRPRSLVLPRGVSDSSLQFHSGGPSTTISTPTSESHYYINDRDDEGRMQSYEREREPRHSTLTRDSTRRTHHGHARSLDLTNRPHVFDRNNYHDGIHERQLAPHRQLSYGPDSSADPNKHSRSNPHSFQPASGYNGPDQFLGSTKGQAFADENLDYHEDSSAAIRAGVHARELSTGSTGGGRMGVGLGYNKASSRKLARRGPGPYLKKHQILQQQLLQMQREQEEMEVQLASQQQQEQQRYIQETSTRARPSQHSRHISMDQEFYSHHHQQQQQQPQQGRPPKQRVLMRSESVSSGIHGTHQSHSHLPQLQPQQQYHYQQSIVPQQSQQQPSQSRRRQNHHQTILLRPVSLPSLSDHSSSSLYCTQPPPGQPLYRSMHAPYLVSPSSLTSVASTASSGSTLHTMGGVVNSVDQESLPQEPEPTVISPNIPRSVTPPTKGLNLHSPPYSQNDLHGHMSSQQTYGYHHPSQQQRGGVMSRSDSRTESMSNSTSNNTLVYSNSQQSLHRHSASLPAMHYSSSTMHQSDLQHHQQQQHHCTDHARPPIQRHDMDSTAKKSSPPSCYKTMLPAITSEGLISNATSDDEPVHGLLIRTPPQDN
ncbi:hypothetical protein BGZ76_001882 [Entomortierella beljakovae]|nr:hypothetical protein BGZ76_001882 [Entomortierella beljakovae]